MPKGHLTERYVQNAAVKWLEERYNNNTDLQVVVALQFVKIQKSGTVVQMG